MCACAFLSIQKKNLYYNVSPCNTVQGDLPDHVTMAGFGRHPKPPLIRPSATLLSATPTTGIIFGINENTSPGFQGENVLRGQPKDIERGTECERGRNTAEKSGREGDYGENKCNMDKSALLIGLWAHRF